jgi:hypothetical protein
MQTRLQKLLCERLAEDQAAARAELASGRAVCAEELAEIENVVLRTLYRERSGERALAVS